MKYMSGSIMYFFIQLFSDSIWTGGTLHGTSGKWLEDNTVYFCFLDK